MIPRKASSRSLSSLSQLQQTAALRLLAPRSRRRTIKQKWSTEPLETRQLLTGDFVWASALQSTGQNYGETTVVTSDGSGSIYAAGRYRGTLDFDPGTGTAVRSSASVFYDIFITKTSAEGNLQWVKTFGGAGDELITDIALDSQGNICLSGTFEGQVDMDPGAGIELKQSQDYEDGFALRLNSAADFSGFAQFNEQVEQIAIAPGGEILAGGRFSNGDDLNPGIGVNQSFGRGGFVVKMSEQLDFQWVWTKKAPEPERAEVREVAVSANGDILVGVGFLESAYEIPTGMLVSRLTSTGEEYWATGSEKGRINGGCFDNEGNTYIAGGASGAFTFNGVNISNSSRPLAFVIKIDLRGDPVWFRKFGSYDAAAESVEITRDDNIVLSGIYRGTTDLDPGTGTEIFQGSAERSKGFVSSLTSNGDFRWARSFEGTGGQSIEDLHVSDFGIIIAGSYSGQTDFDPGPGTAVSQQLSLWAPFIVKLAESVAYTDPGGSDLVLRRNGKYLELFRRHIAYGDTLLERHYLASKPAIDIFGSNTVSNSLIIDFATGGTFTTAGIRFNGGSDTANNDRVTIIGANFEGATYRPSGGGFSEFRIHNQSISLFQSESAIASGMISLTMETAAGADVLTMSPVTGYRGVPATRITGTTAGQTLIPLTFSNVPQAILDTGLNDLTLATSHDSVTVAAGGLEATGLLSLIVRTGKGNDTLKVNGPDIGLPGTDGTAGGTFSFLAGSGTDRIAAAGDTNWQVSDNRLRSSGGGNITLDDIEKATLAGGDAANTLTATGFTGDLTADGGAGHDLIRGNSGNDYLLGGTGNDRIYGADGDDQLLGQDGNDSLYGNADEDVLKGGAGNDRLFGGDDDDRVLGEVGDDTLFGGSGNDSLDGGDGNDLLNGESGNDSLIGGVGRDLYEFNGTSNAEDLRLLRSSATIAAFQRKPRGLLSVLERDAVTMDASDEFVLYALGGDDLIAIDSLFTQLGFVDGGDGTDTCTSPTAWSKVSC